MAFCFAHANVEATGTCDDCKKPICTKCTKGTLDGFMCPPCAQKRYGRRKLVTALKVGGVVVGLVGLAVFGLIVVGKGSEKGKPPPDAALADKDPFIATLKETRDLAPCDKEAVRKLVLELMELHRYADAVDAGTAYFAKCDEFPRLRSNLIYALHQLGRYAEALKHETAMIERDPYDSDYWWWRGEDQSRTDAHEQALADYRQSIANSDGANYSKAAVSRILDTAGPAGRPCEGVAAIRYFEVAHEGVLSRDLDERARGIDQTSSCARTRGTGTFTLPPPGEEVKLQISINGNPGTFLIETRAGTSVLTTAYAQLAQVQSRPGVTVQTVAVGSVRTGAPATANLNIGTAVAPETEVLIADGLPPGVDGVLGLSALWKFKISYRDTDGAMILEPLP
jgi:hypothetical protein